MSGDPLRERLRVVRVLDYNASYSVAPPTVEAVINLDEIVSAIPCESRHAGPTMCVRFRDGHSVTVVGTPAELTRQP